MHPTRLNPAFVGAIRADRTPRAMQARIAGFRSYTALSAILSSACVSTTAKTIDRLVKLARLVDFPVDQIFEDDVDDPSCEYEAPEARV